MTEPFGLGFTEPTGADIMTGTIHQATNFGTQHLDPLGFRSGG